MRKLNVELRQELERSKEGTEGGRASKSENEPLMPVPCQNAFHQDTYELHGQTATAATENSRSPPVDGDPALVGKCTKEDGACRTFEEVAGSAGTRYQCRNWTIHKGLADGMAPPR